MKFRLLLLLLVSLCLSALYLQAQHPVYRHFTIDDGLPSSEIYHIFQDSRGYIWIATNMGVSRYDGNKFTNFDKQDGLAENTVFEVYEDGSGRVWFVSFPCQLSYFYNGELHAYRYNQILKVLAGHGYIPLKGSFIVNRDESINIGFIAKGLYLISAEGKVSIEPGVKNKEELSIIEKNGNLLLSQHGGNTIVSFVDVNTSIIKQRLPVKFSSNYSYSNIYISKDDNAVYFAQNEFLSRIDKKGQISERNFVNRAIYLKSDINNNLWVGTDKLGVFCFKNGKIDAEPVSHYLEELSVSSIYVDSEGGKWFGTIEDGVFYLSSDSFESYTIDDGLTNNKLSDVTLFNGQLVIGAHDPFINIISGGVISTLKVSESKNGIINRLLNVKNQTLWIGTNDYLYSLEKGEKKKYTNNHWSRNSFEKSRKVFSIKDLILDKGNNLVIGESSGLTFFKDGIVFFNSLFDLKYELRIDVVKEIDAGRFLLGTNSGLWQFSKQKFENLGDRNPIFHNRVTDIVLLKDIRTFALGTKGTGLIVNLTDTIINLNKSHGLSSNSISSLLLLGDSLWIGTNYGLNVLDVNKIGKTDFKITSYFKSNGLISNEINRLAGDDNNVYIATNQGLTVFNYRNYKPVSVKPPIYISGYGIMKRDTIIKSGYRLKDNQNLISFHYIGLSFRDAGNLKYKYRLKGLNDEWNYTTITEVEYAFLPSGDYVFEVVAINPEGIESAEAANISFTILPPFYKTWWFILIMLLILAAGVYLYYRNRLKQLKKEHELRNDINWYRQQALTKQMDPHFVFNTLNSIQSFIINNDRLSSSQYLSKFAKLMRLILNNSQKQAVSLGDEINAINLYLELESLRFQQKFEFNLEIVPVIDTSNCFIPPFLIQPYVENAIWHGIMGLDKPGRISIGLIKKQYEITCTIEDNGIGRKRSLEMKTDLERKKRSFGIELVESRLNLLNSLYGIDMKVVIVDLYDDNGQSAGTRVVINLPLMS